LYKSLTLFIKKIEKSRFFSTVYFLSTAIYFEQAKSSSKLSPISAFIGNIKNKLNTIPSLINELTFITASSLSVVG
jgi:hypothetical protein